MSADCPFCAIAAGDIPARIVADTEDALAFLDANPLAPGHTLVIPRAHRERLADLQGDEATRLYTLLHRVVRGLESTVSADGLTVGFNDGAAAGQEVPHVHGHVVPRFDDDGNEPLHALFDDRPSLSDGELDDLADEIGDAVSR